jgi:hypothetical protein
MGPSSSSKDPSVRRIVVVTRRKSKNYGRSSIRGNHMNLVFHPPRDLPMTCGPFS